MNKAARKSQKHNILICADPSTHRKINVGAALLGISKKELTERAINHYLDGNAELKKMNFQTILAAEVK